METNAKIVSDIKKLSSSCKDLIAKISEKKDTKTSLYLIEKCEGADIDGIQVEINTINPFDNPDFEGHFAQQVHVGAQNVRGGRRHHAPRGSYWDDDFDGGAGHRPPQPAQQDKDGNRTFVEVSVPRFELIRRPIVTPSQYILQKMSFSVAITPANDLFNDKLDYTVSSYAFLLI